MFDGQDHSTDGFNPAWICHEDSYFHGDVSSASFAT